MNLDILAFGAHPDDVELGCGGTIIKEVENGKKVGIIDLTLGELGTRGNVEKRKQESKKANKEWVRQGLANSPLGLYLDIDFELRQTVIKPSEDWCRLHPDKNVDIKLLQQESNIYNNLIEQYDMLLEVIKISNIETVGKV